MRTQRRLASCVTNLAVLLTLTACGGGGGDEEAPRPVDSNRAPAAAAGPDQTVFRNATVTLDGSASSDPDGNPLAYRWTQTAGAAVSLNAATSASPSFTAPTKSGVLTFSLVTNDGKVDSAADSISITVSNRSPKAVAGDDMTVATGVLVLLDGSTSIDPDGDALITYTWVQLSGPPVTLTNIATGKDRFLSPLSPTSLVFGLVVSDGEMTSVQDTTTVHVVPNTSNRVPLANAGPDFVTARRSQVTLGGWGYDPDGAFVTFEWEQTSGATVTLADASSPMPSFTAPDSPQKLTFALRVTDGVLTSVPDEVVVDVQNFAPSVTDVALTPASAYTADNLTLTATVNDPDGDALTTKYEWRRNGVLVNGQTSATYPASLTTKNDVVNARITVSDALTETIVEATTTILDSPAVLSASPPTALDYGDTASFTITASDPDGDAVNGFEVAHGPAGFSVTSQGLATWTAAGPMFDREMDFHWGVRVQGDAVSLLTGTFRVTDANRKQPVRRTGIQIPAQHDGLHIGDFDGDGDNEILVGAPRALYVLTRNGSTYQQSWTYPFDAGGGNTAVGAVAALDLNGDGKQEIFFAQGDTVVRLDGATRREAARHSAAGQHCRGLELADLEADGSVELVCLAFVDGYIYGNSRLVVLNPSTLAPKWNTPELTLGGTIAIGNVDQDAALEIVTAGGYVFDGQSHANQWVYGPGFGIAADTGDVDGDGVEEIVGAVDWSVVRAFSAVSKSPLWEIAPPGFYSDLDALVVADTTGDGIPEILVGNGQWGNITAFRYNTSTNLPETLWQIDSQEHGVTSIAVGDVDGGGTKEIVWGSGASSSGRDDLVIAGFTPAIAVKWQSSSEPQLDGPFAGGALARIGGGATRLMFGSTRTNSGYDGFRPVALDPSSGDISIAAQTGTNWAHARALDVADYDLDGVDELFIGTASLYDGFLLAFDFGANVAEWTSPTGIGTAVAITHADLSGDGRADLIGITAEGYIQAYNVHAQTLLWKSTGMGAGGVDVEVADLDDDGVPEIIGVAGNRIVVYRKTAGPGYLEAASVNVSGVRDLLVADTNGDDTLEIYALHSDFFSGAQASLGVYDPHLALLRTVPLGSSAASFFLEESAFGRKNLLISGNHNDYPYQTPGDVWAADPATGVEVWRSPALMGSVTVNGLHFVDTDGDGDKEIVFGTDWGMNFTQ